MFIGNGEGFNWNLSLWLRSRINAARIAICGLPRVWRTGLLALNTLLLLSLYDALFGGGLSASLQFDGWSSSDQWGNDFYQISFGVICFATFGFVFKYDKIAALILVVMLLGYWEDLLYYLILPAFSPVFEWRGLPEVNPGLPDEISGWIGLISRVLNVFCGTPEIKLEQIHFFGMLTISLSIAAGVLAWLEWQDD